LVVEDPPEGYGVMYGRIWVDQDLAAQNFSQIRSGLDTNAPPGHHGTTSKVLKKLLRPSGASLHARQVDLYGCGESR
jgi:hypothetical protein